MISSIFFNPSKIKFPINQSPTRRTYDDYSARGYVAIENALSGAHGDAVSSFTLYAAYHDWCIAQMAKGLGRQEIYDRFIKGATNYHHVIWPEKQCAWVRRKDGGWMSDFKPVKDSFEQKGFCETSAAISTFFVPHDPMDLAELLGGPQAAADMLDGQFEKAAKHNFYLRGRNHGSAWVDYANQDGTGAAHYFNRIGYPWLTQKWAREVQVKTYSAADPFGGYNGDEDQGQMGALSALLALGLFQFDGGSGIDPKYDITAPIFDQVTIRLSDEYDIGNTFTIVAGNQGPANVYIQSATWNGVPLNKPLLPHEDLVRGGVLQLNLGPNPNRQWGR